MKYGEGFVRGEHFTKDLREAREVQITLQVPTLVSQLHAHPTRISVEVDGVHEF